MFVLDVETFFTFNLNLAVYFPNGGSMKSNWTVCAWENCVKNDVARKEMTIAERPCFAHPK